MRVVCAALLLTVGCQKLFPLSGGEGTDAPTDGPDPVEHNLAFVTGSVFLGTFGGLVEADAHCQAAAVAGGLPPNTYVAWLSDSNTNAIDRLANARGWIRSDGRAVADRPASLAAVGPLVPLLFNEDGQSVLASVQNVWTGTDSSGAKADQHCGDWLLPTTGVYGTLERGGKHFTATNAAACTESKRLYCLGIDHANPLTIPPPDETTPILFVSDGTWSPNNPAEADQLCAAEAQVASLSGGYRAVLTRDGQPLSALFDTSTIFSRIDGVALGAVLTGAAQTYPLLSASKQVIVTGSVWTGGLGVGTAASTCNDWTNSGSGSEGLPYTATTELFQFDLAPCNHPAHVYCARYQ